VIQMKCHYCGIVFQAERKARKFCSLRCQHDKRMSDARAKNSRACKQCGKLFVPTHGGRVTQGTGSFCGRVCYGRYMIENKTNLCHNRVNNSIGGYYTGAKCQVFFRVCLECGDTFTTNHRDSALCPDECKYQRHLAYMRGRYERSWKTPEPFKCKHCGIMHQPVFGDKRSAYCSETCLQRAARRQSRYGKCETRRRLAETRGERFDPVDVLKRDGWRCQICGKKLKPSNRGTYVDDAPELDHIIPLSQGGEHSRRNTQCACRQCNLFKSDKMLGQLRLFG